MLVAAIVILAATLALVVRQLRDARRFTALLATEPPSPSIAAWPPTAVVLAVRGGSAELTACLDRIAALDYPDFELHVVVDHESDPAFEIVERWSRAQTKLRTVVQTLRSPSARATLKCSAVHQALESLDSRIEVVALIDADALVHPGWLQELVAPLAADTADMATGNRWYDPTAAGLGSLIRFIYNANAVIPMHEGRMTWGGSLALARRVFADPSFQEYLLRSPTEDATVRDAVERHGRRLAMLPHLMVPSGDGIGLSACLRFIRRQLLWTRLYHPAWPVIASGAVVAYGAALGIAGAAAWACASGQGLAAAAFAASLVAATVGNLAVVERLHAAVRRTLVIRQARTIPSCDALTRLRLLAALPLSLPAFTAAAVSAAWARRVRWSGIDYAVVPPDGVRMLGHTPLLPTGVTPPPAAPPALPPAACRAARS